MNNDIAFSTIAFSTEEQSTRFISERRIAFLMAWHPRLGRNSNISNYLNKDIGRLIARRYVTLKTQCYENEPFKDGIIISDVNQLVIGVKKSPMVMKHPSTMRLYKVIAMSLNMCIVR